MAQTKDKAFGVVGFVGLGAMGGRMVRNLKGVADLLVFDADQPEPWRRQPQSRELP